MKFQYDDGGRAAAGFKGSAGDCVTRAIAIAAELPYMEVYEALSKGMGSQRSTKRSKARGTARDGISTSRKWFKDYMASIGWTWVPTMGIGTGCKVHLRDGELPMGRIIARVSRHYVAVIDGILHDTHDPSDRGVTIYPPNYTGTLPKGAEWLENGNGWAYAPDRCVYGYWVRAALPA
jgi:hypothetical protein